MDAAEQIKSALVASGGMLNPEYISPTLDVSASPLHVPTKRLQGVLAGHEYPFAAAGGWKSLVEWDEAVEFLAQLGEVTFESDMGRDCSAYCKLEGDKGVVVLELNRSWCEWSVTVAAPNRKGANAVLEALRAFLPAPPPPPPEPPRPDNEVRVHFWMQDPRSGYADSITRWITTHYYSGIQNNYAASLRQDQTTKDGGTALGLDSLMAMQKGPEGGQGKLVLFHGPPGTGKTRAILSLISEWRKWCSASVVTDSDRFFGDATYMNSIVFNAIDSGWLLLVIEDGDEFLNVDAKDSKGQSIARLLNLADGIVGQGVQLLTLMSTNVDVAKLNPAVVRDGRALTNLHFDHFSPEDATAWCEAHGLPGQEFDQKVPLAKLYARLRANGIATGSEFEYADEVEADRDPDEVCVEG